MHVRTHARTHTHGRPRSQMVPTEAWRLRLLLLDPDAFRPKISLPSRLLPPAQVRPEPRPHRQVGFLGIHHNPKSRSHSSRYCWCVCTFPWRRVTVPTRNIPFPVGEASKPCSGVPASAQWAGLGWEQATTSARVSGEANCGKAPTVPVPKDTGAPHRSPATVATAAAGCSPPGPTAVVLARQRRRVLSAGWWRRRPEPAQPHEEAFTELEGCK